MMNSERRKDDSVPPRKLVGLSATLKPLREEQGQRPVPLAGLAGELAQVLQARTRGQG